MNLRHLVFPKEIDTIGSLNKSVRDQWIEGILQSLPAGTALLDAGAGKMPYRKHCSHLRYTSQDFCGYDGIGDGTGLQTRSFDTTGIDIVSDITAMPLPDNGFDAVLCSEVLEHVPDAGAAMHELIRVLKPGGLLIVTAPFCSLTHYAPYHFATGFNRYFFETFSDRLMIEALLPNGNYFEYLAQEVKRVPSVAAQYGNMRLGWWQRLINYAFLAYLSKSSKASKGSDELLCFGYHFLGRKK